MLTSIKNPQSNAPVERVHQILNYMFLTKDLNSQTFDYIDPWGEILSSIAWAVRASHHTTFDKNPAQLVFMIQWNRTVVATGTIVPLQEVGGIGCQSDTCGC